MDSMKLPTITKKQYDEIADIVNQAKSCDSLRAAKQYIERIEFCARNLPDRCGIKAGEVASYLQVYCKQTSD